MTPQHSDRLRPIAHGCLVLACGLGESLGECLSSCSASLSFGCPSCAADAQMSRLETLQNPPIQSCPFDTLFLSATPLSVCTPGNSRMFRQFGHFSRRVANLRQELQVQAGSADERWLTSLRLPSDVAGSAVFTACEHVDICRRFFLGVRGRCLSKHRQGPSTQSQLTEMCSRCHLGFVQGYLVRKQVAEANAWLQQASLRSQSRNRSPAPATQAQKYSSSTAGLKEALRTAEPMERTVR